MRSSKRPKGFRHTEWWWEDHYKYPEDEWCWSCKQIGCWLITGIKEPRPQDDPALRKRKSLWRRLVSRSN